MRSFWIVLIFLLATVIVAVPVSAQVAIGVGPVAVIVPPSAPMMVQPVCPYGYYGAYPYSCAPYGYYGSAWFNNGIFIGAGPWYRMGWYGPGRAFYARGYWDNRMYAHPSYGYYGTGQTYGFYGYGRRAGGFRGAHRR